MASFNTSGKAPKNAQDWVRQLRFSNDVNMSTVGVDTDRVTPQLMLASSKKLLGISRGQQEGDAKDSLRYQKVFGPVEYFAQRIQKDGGSVARSMLWKATNRGNVDFINSGSLQPHVSAVFHQSNLSQFVDNSTPLDGIDNSMKVTRVGEGGISSDQVAPIEMRLVQPSYYGYIGSARTAQRCYRADTLILTKKGWKPVTQMSMDDEFATLIDGRPAWNKPIALNSYDHDGPMYCYNGRYIKFSVTPNHRMYVASDKDYSIQYIDQVFGNTVKVLCAVDKASKVDQNQKWFYLPQVQSTTANCKNIQKVDIVDFAQFMGWYLSQGSHDSRATKHGQKYRVRITQSPTRNPEHYAQVLQLMDRLPFTYSVDSRDGSADIVILRKQLYMYVKQFGHSEDKFIPEWIFHAPTAARWAFVDAILKGDGKGARDLCTISSRLANDFARLMFELGQSVNIIKELQKYEHTKRQVNPQEDFLYTVTWHRTFQSTLQGLGQRSGYYVQEYKGKVYCPTVPGGLVYVKLPGAAKGFWCGNSPGITGYMTKNVMKGTDGKLYQNMLNVRTGKIEPVDSQKAAASVVTTNEYMNTDDEYVYAMGGPRGVRIVKKSDIDYILPHSDDAYSMAANYVPMYSGIKSMRLLMGCLHPDTPVLVVDKDGYTDIIPAKRVGHVGTVYLAGCDSNGSEALYKVKNVVPRVPDKKSKFRKVILQSGRTLITSPCHKWYIYSNDKFELVPASQLKQGMLVPRTVFQTVPVRSATVAGKSVTKQIAVLMGRLCASLQVVGTTVRFSFVRDRNPETDQRQDITDALAQLGVVNYTVYTHKQQTWCNIKDCVFRDWIAQNIGRDQQHKRIPKSMLSLDRGYTSIFLDSFFKTLDTVAQDITGDNWLLRLPNPTVRDGVAFMLTKIDTDTNFRDAVLPDHRIHRALHLLPIQRGKHDVILQPIVSIEEMPTPGMMIDIDCDDNVYAVANGIITHNSKYGTQAVPLQQRQAPFVRALDQQSGQDMPTRLGRLLGTQWAEKPGMVKAVRKDRIDMLYDDGTKGSVYLYDNFPANAKGWLTNYVKVKAGDKVAKGQLLASSNYTDDNGVAATGRNLRVGYMSYHGATYEDACALSQSAAKKMGYTIMYKTGMDKDKSIRTSKQLYNTWKPGQYTKQQLQKLDDFGVVKPGTVLQSGDPMILGIRTTEPSPGTLGKRILTDVTQTWQHSTPGVVTDVTNTKSGIKVYATISKPLQVGDKMCYDEQTQVLTADGWKRFAQLTLQDKVYTLDPDSDTIQLQHPMMVHRYRHKDPMYKLCTRDIDLMVTPNHRNLVKLHTAQGPAKYQLVQASQHYGELLQMRTGAGSARRDVPVNYAADDVQQWVAYDGYVYCATVQKYHTLYVRRNGKAVWSGNSGFQGSKGTVAQVIPDDKMPRDSQGRPLQLLFDPLGIISRTNPSQLMQAGLGKVAAKTGKPIVMPQFMPKGQSRLKYVKDLMKQNNVPWSQDVYDPQSGRTIKNVFTGVAYYMPLKHLAQSKMSARGTEGYDASGVPKSGGEHGCFPAMQNILTIHGQKSIATICQKRIPQYVMSWDKQRKEWVWRQVTDWFAYRAKTQDILNIFTQNAISCYGGKSQTRHTTSSYPTKNHKMYMADGTVKLAGQLKVGQYLAGVGAVYTQDQKQALLGTLMGDSCRNSQGGIQCIHSMKQFKYLNYKRDIFAAVGASRASTPYAVRSTFSGTQPERKVHQAIWLRIPKSYWVQQALEMTTDSAGTRHLTIPVLQAMGQFGFCMWFLDDGSVSTRAKKKGQFRPQACIATLGFTVQQVQQAAKWLQKNLLHMQGQTSISLYTGLHGQIQPQLRFHRQASIQICRIIAKHIPWDVIPQSKVLLRRYCKKVQQVTPCVQHNFNSPLGIVPLKIKQIKPYKHDKPNITQVNVYDFTVDKTHNYCLSGGVSVSNSKRLGTLESSALVGHDAFDFLTQDAKLIRGQSNADFWRSIRTGQIPVVPGQPLVHKKFFAHLQASGLNVRRSKQGVSLFALSTKDVDDMAGNRQLKSTDTYEQKNFRPIDGGLFGQDIFGPDGTNWGYIQLDSPLPNPVMQQPLARLLRMSDKDFQAVAQGRATVNGISNATQMKQALAKIDLQKEAQQSLVQLKDARPSKKDAALKRYVAIAKMRDNGVPPQDYMLDRIPVLPPKFRPITQHGGLTMVADSNYLYAQLLNARDDLRQAQKEGLPAEYITDANAKLYTKWKELVGLYDPQDVKLKNKSVKGLLKWALGTSPKRSAFATKVLGSTVDTVGRGVVVPSTKIKLNEIGMPVDMAWDVYAPFVVRKLVQRNYTPVDAMKMVKQRVPAAFDALQQAVSERPVVMNRAPSLHKLSLMGFNVRLTSGKAIRINPSIVVPFNCDFDGNCCDFDSEIYLKISKSALDKLDFLVYITSINNQERKEGMKVDVNASTALKFTNQKDNSSVFVNMKIGNFPRVGTPVKDRNGADVYRLPKGVEVAACDPLTGKRGFYEVEALTVEDNCDTVKVKAGDREVIVSTNESMAVFDQTTGALTKVAPKDLEGKLVPILKQDPTPFGTFGDRDLGWVLGSLISDGWVNGNIVGYAKTEDKKRAEVERILRQHQPNFHTSEYRDKPAPGRNKLGESVKIHMYGKELAEWVRQFKLLDLPNGVSKKTACYKQINPDLIQHGTEEMLWGLLSGLMDGDGCFVLNTATGKPRFTVRYSTSSPALRDTMSKLLYRLGIRYSITTTPPRGMSNEAYTIMPSSIDIYANLDKLTCIGQSELELIAKWKASSPDYTDKKDCVPVSDAEWAILKTVCTHTTDSGMYTAMMTNRSGTRKGMRSNFYKYDDFLKENIPLLYARVHETNTLWSSAEVVEDTGKRQVFDFLVKDAKVFAVNNGFVIWDTVNLHVPVSQAGIRDVRQKMMPEHNLISARKRKILYAPQKAYTQGLYVATRMGEAKDVKTFDTLQEAKDAYRKGLIDVDTPILIKEKQ